MVFDASDLTKNHAEVFFSAIDGLKKLYKSKILPVEELYKFHVTSPPLG